MDPSGDRMNHWLFRFFSALRARFCSSDCTDPVTAGPWEWSWPWPPARPPSPAPAPSRTPSRLWCRPLPMAGAFMLERACACAAATAAEPPDAAAEAANEPEPEATGTAGAPEAAASGRTCLDSSDRGWPLQEMLNALYQPKGDCLTS